MKSVSQHNSKGHCALPLRCPHCPSRYRKFWLLGGKEAKNEMNPDSQRTFFSSCLISPVLCAATSTNLSFLASFLSLWRSLKEWSFVPNKINCKKKKNELPYLSRDRLFLKQNVSFSSLLIKHLWSTSSMSGIWGTQGHIVLPLRGFYREVVGPGKEAYAWNSSTWEAEAEG